MSEETPHTHDGVLEVTIPPIVLQVACLAGIGFVIAFLGYSWWRDRKADEQSQAFLSGLKEAAADMNTHKHEVMVAVAPPIGDTEP